MKILVTSDWHMDVVTAGVVRFPEIEKFMDLLIEVVNFENVDLFLHLGDFFNPGGMLVTYYIDKLMEFLNILIAFDTKVILLAGNHDVVEDSRLITTISPIKHLNDGMCIVSEKPEVKIVTIGEKRLNFLLLPYFSRSALKDCAIDDAIDAASFDKNKDCELIVAGHLSLTGAILGNESKEMARGRSLTFPAESIRKLNPYLIFNGHYHRSQIVENSGVIVPGSPLRLNFGEKDDSRKGYIIVEV